MRRRANLPPRPFRRARRLMMASVSSSCTKELRAMGFRANNVSGCARPSTETDFPRLMIVAASVSVCLHRLCAQANDHSLTSPALSFSQPRLSSLLAYY